VGGPVIEDCLKLIHSGGEVNRCVRYGIYDIEDVAQAGGAEVYIEVIRKPATAIIVGAGHIGLYLTKIAKVVGFEVIIVDDRAEFANAERLPDADKVVAADVAGTLANLKIDADTYVVLVTRGHKHDEIALREVVNSNAAYIGMIGSRARVRTVQERLIRDGFAKEKVDRVYAPIGLDIGASTPEEIALSIVAEMVKVRRGGEGRSMKERVRRQVFEGSTAD
jgi:xanthine dehydrogenase accessory factor